jgi:ankyrin repeat protein
MGLANKCGEYGVVMEREIGEMFEREGHIERYLEEGGFGVLHRAVVSGRDMGSLLASGEGGWAEELDRRSEAGLTPLHLAATKGDVMAARALIRAGAEVDVRTSGGAWNTPLWYACRYGHAEGVKALVTGGADIAAKDSAGKQVVHIAAISGQAKKVLQVLLKYGADVNARGEYSYSPLTYAVVYGPADAVEYLLDRGAHIGVTTTQGQSIVMMALWAARHENMRVLLRRGASLDGVDDTGRNVLHFLALNGDEKMLGVFSETRLWRGWSGVLTKDETGSTPLALFNERKPGEELRAAFDCLLECIEMSVTEDDISESEFYDAQEWLDGVSLHDEKVDKEHC